MKIIYAILSPLLLIFFQTENYSHAGTPTATEILNRVDEARIPKISFRTTVKLTEYVDGKVRAESTVVVFKKSESKVGKYIAIYTEPPRDSGNLVQVVPGKFWYYDSKSKVSIRISAQQRLLGHASIADALSQYLSVDYSPTLVGTETIQDVDRNSVLTWHLELKGVTENAAYFRGECWVDQRNYRLVKCKYFTDGGRPLKTVYYHKFASDLGLMMSRESVILDAVDTKSITTVETKSIAAKDVPDQWFQKDYLPYLKAD